MRFLLALCLVLTACGSGKPDPGNQIAAGGDTALEGVLLGTQGTAFDTGVINVTIKGTLVKGLHGLVSNVVATGNVKLKSHPREIPLAGAYDSGGKLVVTGGDYTFTATTADGGVLVGTFAYDGMEPPPVVAGSFVLLPKASEAYCGTLSDRRPVVLVASSTAAQGLYPLGAKVAGFGGPRAGDGEGFTASGGDGSSVIDITGTTMDFAKMTGTYTADAVEGTFEADSSGCF